jgi:hypothetical protein
MSASFFVPAKVEIIITSSLLLVIINIDQTSIFDWLICRREDFGVDWLYSELTGVNDD